MKKALGYAMYAGLAINTAGFVGVFAVLMFKTFGF